jgi:hypothetical protein
MECLNWEIDPPREQRMFALTYNQNHLYENTEGEKIVGLLLRRLEPGTASLQFNASTKAKHIHILNGCLIELP